MDASPDLTSLQQALGVTFDDQALLRQALIHRSYLNEVAGARTESNERLEFLGDAVLGFVVADRLYRELPDATEGELTTMRAALVRMETLHRAAERIRLGRYLVLSRGEEMSGGRTRRQTLGRAFEAIIGAAYVDGGLERARRVIWDAIEHRLQELLRTGVPKDVKSRLQEYVQARFGDTPAYRHISAEGPSHARMFTVEVLLRGDVIGTGAGPTKRDAERAAARSALDALSAPAQASD